MTAPQPNSIGVSRTHFVRYAVGNVSKLHILEPRAYRKACIVRAAEEFCRDKVGAPASTVSIEGTSQIAFLGAGGQSVEIEARKDTYILDSGLDAGLELPFTCRGGICGACVGRIAEGEVDQSDVRDESLGMALCTFLLHSL